MQGIYGGAEVQGARTLSNFSPDYRVMRTWMRLLCSLFSYIFTWSSFHPRLSWSSNRVTWNEPMDMHKGGISDGEGKEPLG